MMKIYRKQVIRYNSDDCEVVVEERFSLKPFGDIGETYDESTHTTVRINEIEVEE